MKSAARVAAACLAALVDLGCERPAAHLALEHDAPGDAARPTPSAAPIAELGATTIQLPDGDEIFAIDPTAVKEVESETPGRSIAAIRAGGGGAHFTMVEKDSTGRVIRRCSRKGPFDRTFGELHSIRIRSKITQDRLAALRRGENAKLRIVSVIAGEPSEWNVAPIDDPEPQLALLVEHASYELGLSPPLVALLAKGCATPDAK